MIQITPRFCPPYSLTFLLFFSVQTKQYKIKTWKVHMHTTNKQTWSLLILSNYFWAYGLHWSVIDILSVLYHWKKTDLRLSQQLSIANNLLARSWHWDYFFFFFSVLWFLSRLNLYKSCACYHSLCEFTCESTLLCLENDAASAIPRGYTLSMSSLQRAPSLEFNKDISLSIKDFTVSHALHNMQVWVTVLITIYCKKKLFWWEVSNVLIYGYNNTLSGLGLFLYSLSGVVA